MFLDSDGFHCFGLALLSGYITGEGTSGSTYQQGALSATERCCPAIVFFENVIGVAESSTDREGVKHPPMTQARLIKQYIYILVIFKIVELIQGIF